MDENYVRTLINNLNAELQTFTLDRINLKTQLQIANQKIESFAQQVDELKRANIELNEKLASVNTEEVKVRKKKA
jgi:prefoldin subunit 5|tara:strand:- start:276 stop:500 length:225 start_codon:yes stop_codon:yes gene_type:complete